MNELQILSNLTRDAVDYRYLDGYSGMKTITRSTLLRREKICDNYLVAQRWLGHIKPHWFDQRCTTTRGRIRVIYFVQMLCSNGYIKIGSTRDLWGRINAFRIGNPYRFRILGLKLGSDYDEKRIQGELKEVGTSISGEWFSTCKHMLRVIYDECDIHFLDYGNPALYELPGSGRMWLPRTRWVVPFENPVYSEENQHSLRHKYKQATWQGIEEYDHRAAILTTYGSDVQWGTVRHKDDGAYVRLVPAQMDFPLEWDNRHKGFIRGFSQYVWG